MISGTLTNLSGQTSPDPDGHHPPTGSSGGAARFMFSALACSALMSSPTTATPADLLTDRTCEIDQQTSTGGAIWILPSVFPDPVNVRISSQKAKFSDSVANLRELSGLTWDQIAKLFGVSRRAVHHWATGGKLTARNTEVLRELTQQLTNLQGYSPEDRRAELLAPDANGYSLYDRLRSRYASSTLDVSGTPFTPEQLLSALPD